jgi:flagellar motor switch protein FliN
MASDHALSSALTAALIEELAVVLGALVGEAGEASPVPAGATVEWVASSTFGGSVEGSVAIGFTRDDGVSLARAVMGFDDVPDDTAVVDMIQEVAAQAFSALGQRTEAAGASLAPAVVASTGPASSQSSFVVTLGAGLAPVVACWCEAVRVAAAAPTSPTAPTRAEVPTGRAEATGPPVHAAPDNLEVILDIDLPLTVRFGVTEMTLDALTRLGPGSVIDLGRSPDDPVEVLVNGRLVARGEVVVVAGNYGVRIHEVVSAADRIRSLSGPA